MVGRVDNPDDLRKTRSKQTLNTLPDRNPPKAASLTASFETDTHAAFGDTNQGHSSAVGRDGGIHLGVDDPPYALGQISGTARRRSGPRPHDSHFGYSGHLRTQKRLDM